MHTMKYFVTFALLLFIALGYKTYDQYQRIQQTQNLILYNESETLSRFISAFRQTYQDVFLKEHIEVTEKTIHLLPVKTMKAISENFGQSMRHKVVVRTVSDRPRNPQNQANAFELKQIQYFKSHPNIEDAFIQNENTFSYTKPLYIQPSCLKCHGKREDAVPSIRKKYTKAYNYKLGEIRGLLNIKIQEQAFFKTLYDDFKETLAITIVLYIVFLGIIYILLQKLRHKEENYTKSLESEIEEKTEALRRQKDTFETLFEKSSEGILILKEGSFIQCNEKAVKMFHATSKNEILQLHPADLSPEFQPDGSNSLAKANEMIKLSFENDDYMFEWLHLRLDGSYLYAEVHLTPIVLNNQEVIYVTLTDISERKDAQQKLEEQQRILYHQAHHDGLTKLPNRTYFNEYLQETMLYAKAHDETFALFFIDLDQFKQINDSLGHEIGDRVLQIVTERFKAKIGKEDFLARIGGDEFTLIVKSYKSVASLSLMAQKLIDVLAHPIHIEGHTLYISSSIGISLYPKDADDTKENLLKYADAAMYKAKDEGRNNVQFYQSAMTALAFERITMKADLRQALKKKEFIVYYQPQMDAREKRLIGMEALVRWKHPKMGMIPPSEFIPLAQESGLMTKIDQWVMDEAMRQVAQWYAQGFKAGVLALNLTLPHLREKDFIEELKVRMKKRNFKTSWLELEITEGEVMKQHEEAIFKLQQIHDMGIKVAIDDFGTGYSSLAYLKRLPIDKLKIDQSFVKELPSNPEDSAIAKAIIALAKNLHLETIAEGVEEKAQLDFLVAHGCYNIQGYYFGKPMEAQAFKEKFLKA